MLVVSWLLETKGDDPTSGNQVNRREITPAEVAAIDGNRIDLTAIVSRHDISARRRMIGRSEPDMDHIVLTRSPFALHAKKLTLNPQNEIKALALGQRLEDREAQARRLLGDCQLGDVALVVGIVLVHKPMLADKTL
jgi:hypothetical protein